MLDLLLHAFLGGAGAALIAGPVGSFIVWRRLAYFGDTLAHATLLGAAVGLLFEVDPLYGVLAIGQLIALLLFLFQRNDRLASDTILGILSHGALATGLIAISMIRTVRVDLMAYLFGDILAVTGEDLVWIFGGVALVLSAFWFLWKPLLAVTVHEDLARVEGVPVERVNLIFYALVAVAVAILMKVVGLILVTSLLIIPSAAARRLSRTPESMALASSVIGIASVVLGLCLSWGADTPAGPSMVVAALILFLLTQLFTPQS